VTIAPKLSQPGNDERADIADINAGESDDVVTIP
jgi:hypothetical protein